MRASRCLAPQLWLAAVLFLSGTAGAANKVHVIAFGRWITVQWFASAASVDKPLSLKVRPLVVDGKIKEYSIGLPHEITDRLFVVRRAFRVNDELPEESAPRWQWQRGGWLLVDRLTGRVFWINLPGFDPYSSAASWYRDYVAYCGVGDDGEKIYAVVAQLTRRKPVLKKSLSEAVRDAFEPDSVCPTPSWQRNPMRVSFEPTGGEKQTFAIHGSVVDLVTDAEEEE